jgi:predicted DNA-binding transcriptional regulator AlpA
MESTAVRGLINPSYLDIGKEPTSRRTLTDVPVAIYRRHFTFEEIYTEEFMNNIIHPTDALTALLTCPPFAARSENWQQCAARLVNALHQFVNHPETVTALSSLLCSLLAATKPAPPAPVPPANPAPPAPAPLLSAKQLAARWGMSLKSIYRLADEGKIRKWRLPGTRTLRFDLGNLEFSEEELREREAQRKKESREWLNRDEERRQKREAKKSPALDMPPLPPRRKE